MSPECRRGWFFTVPVANTLEDTTFGLNRAPPLLMRVVVVRWVPSVIVTRLSIVVEWLEVGQFSTISYRQMVPYHLGQSRISICVHRGLELAFHMPKRNLSVEV